MFNLKPGFWNLVVGICLLFVIWSLVIAATAAAVPQYINFQGVLRDNNGNLISGTKQMTFSLYDSVSGGTALWSMTSNEVAVNNGLYTVQIGPLGNAELGAGRRWIETAIGTETLSPRLEILSVAYAVTSDVANFATLAGTATTAATANNSDTVDGFHASAIPSAGQLYPLDSGGKISGVPVSAEAASGFALFVDGKMGVATGSNMAAGNGQINSGSVYVDISNTSVTSNSLIFLTAGNNAASNSNGGIRISVITAGSGFRVSTMNGAVASADIPFSYLIIN